MTHHVIASAALRNKENEQIGELMVTSEGIGDPLILRINLLGVPVLAVGLEELAKQYLFESERYPHRHAIDCRCNWCIGAHDSPFPSEPIKWPHDA